LAVATVAAVARQVGISPAEYRQLEAGDPIPHFDTGERIFKPSRTLAHRRGYRC
jgi:hypothetical protein